MTPPPPCPMPMELQLICNILQLNLVYLTPFMEQLFWGFLELPTGYIFRKTESLHEYEKPSWEITPTKVLIN